MKRAGPTRIQADMLDFIAHTLVNGPAPTVAEITDHFGWGSQNNAHQHLRRLEQKGYITTLSGRARSIRIVQRDQFNDAELWQAFREIVSPA